MTELHSWFTANKLTLNKEKSSFTIFKTRQNNIINLPEHIEFLDFKIEKTPYVKYLGVIID